MDILPSRVSLEFSVFKVKGCLQDEAPDEWMYANIICESCQLFFPLPKEGSLAVPREQDQSAENGLNFTWEKLRLGQFWGGDGECNTKFNADQLSASGHVHGSLHGQVISSSEFAQLFRSHAFAFLYSFQSSHRVRSR